MREVLKINPDARIQSGKADYRGSAHFERTHRDTYGKPWNYYGFATRAFGESCDCGEGRG
jgi:hypothetical protein